MVSDEIPDTVLELATQKRAELIEQLADVDDALGEIFLNDEVPTNQQIADAIRRATIGLKFSPVFMGSAIKNTGVQPMLDGVVSYLPNPAETTDVIAYDTKVPSNDSQVILSPAEDAPLVGLAFKLEEGRFGQLTYMRVYQGTLKKGMQIYNARTGKKVKVPRLVRMHSDEMEDIESIGPGEICAIFGVECSSGDTFTDGSSSLTMVSLHLSGCMLRTVYELTCWVPRHPCSCRSLSSRLPSKQRVSRHPIFLVLSTDSKRKIPLSKSILILRARR